MKISRMVNGEKMEFELSSEELYAAFAEQQLKFDMEEIRFHIDEYTELDSDSVPDEKIQNMAENFRIWFDDNECVTEAMFVLIKDEIDEELGPEVYVGDKDAYEAE